MKSNEKNTLVIYAYGFAMTHKKRLTLTLLILLIFSDILETAIHFFFKKAASTFSHYAFRSASDILIFIQAMIFCPFVWISLMCVCAIWIIWTSILSKIDLSVAVPLASFSYLFIPLVSVCILHEQIPWFRWVGMGCILIGVVCISLTTYPAPEAVKESSSHKQ